MKREHLACCISHIDLLLYAKELGDYLAVVVSSEEFDWNETEEMLFHLRGEQVFSYADLVIP